LDTVAPFRAWRYAPKAGELHRLVAPPYDVVGPELQSRLYANSRHNVIRVDLGMTTPSDGACDNQYTRAAAQLEEWKQEGILVRDGEPTITFVEESFVGPDGRASVRHGFLAVLRLRDFEEGVVFPHEQTLSGPKEDRYRLLETARMSLSPVFLLYDLPEDEVNAALKAGPGAREPRVVLAGDDETVTRLWPTSEPDIVGLVTESLAHGRFIIADGHHRYETALRYSRQRRVEVEAECAEIEDRQEAEQPLASDYLLAYFANMADPGLTIYSTHRLVRGVDPRTVATLPEELRRSFSVELLSDGEDDAPAALELFLRENPRGAFGLWSPHMEGAYGLRLLDPEAVQAAAPDRSPAYRALDVTILQELVLGRALGITPEDMARGTHVTYFKDPGEAFAQLKAGEFQVGFFMNPTGLDQIREVAFGGERMPQKATFFYPKLPTGLVFHDLNGRL